MNSNKLSTVNNKVKLTVRIEAKVITIIKYHQ